MHQQFLTLSFFLNLPRNCCPYQVHDLNLDRSTQSVSHTQRFASAALNAMIENINLADVWHIQNQVTRDYTCFSAYHKSHSRIDCFLLSSSLRTGVDLIQVLPVTLSDHNPLLMMIDLSHRFNKTPRWRFNTTPLQDEVFVVQFRKRITESEANNIGTVDDASYVWLATKGCIKDFTSSYASHLKKESVTYLRSG